MINLGVKETSFLTSLFFFLRENKSFGPLTKGLKFYSVHNMFAINYQGGEKSPQVNV